MQAILADLKIPAGRGLPGRQTTAVSRPVQLVVASAALTVALLRLLDKSRAAPTRRPTRASHIEKRLREFERAWERETGERLTTAAFYDRFCAGEIRTRSAASWAKYYEATLARPSPRDGLSHLGLHRPIHG